MPAAAAHYTNHGHPPAQNERHRAGSIHRATLPGADDHRRRGTQANTAVIARGSPRLQMARHPRLDDATRREGDRLSERDRGGAQTPSRSMMFALAESARKAFSAL